MILNKQLNIDKAKLFYYFNKKKFKLLNDFETKQLKLKFSKHKHVLHTAIIFQVKLELPSFAHSGIEDWSLVARVCSDQKDPIGLLDSGDGRVQQVV
jgi:hypothetical protein